MVVVVVVVVVMLIELNFKSQLFVYWTLASLRGLLACRPCFSSFRPLPERHRLLRRRPGTCVFLSATSGPVEKTKSKLSSECNETRKKIRPQENTEVMRGHQESFGVINLHTVVSAGH